MYVIDPPFHVIKSSLQQSLKELKTTDSATKPPCAVIVTIYEGSSYDPLMRGIFKTEKKNRYNSIISLSIEIILQTIHYYRSRSEESRS